MTPTSERSSRLRIPALIVLVGLILAELTLRASAAHLQKVLEWPDWEMANKVTAVDKLAARGGASVVMLGNSIVNAGVDPVQLTAALGDPRPAFNAALNGSGIQSMRLWALKIVVRRLHPRVVVIGLDGHTLNSDGKAERNFYKLLLGSAGWRKVAGSSSMYQSIADRASDLLYLVRYRSIIRTPASWFSVDTTWLDQRVDAYGVLHPRKRTVVKPGVKIHKFRTFDKDNFDKKVGRTRLNLLAKLVTELQAQGIAVVFVRMPTVDEINVSRTGPGVYAKIEATMKTFVDRYHVAYIDTRPFFTDTGWYSDVHHVNVRGREKLTEMLVPVLRSVSAT